MSDLRERLIDLSGVMCDSGHGDEFDRKCLALAAARMALEAAVRLCEKERPAYRINSFDDGIASGARDCACAIHAAAGALK